MHPGEDERERGAWHVPRRHGPANADYLSLVYTPHVPAALGVFWLNYPGHVFMLAGGPPKGASAAGDVSVG